MPFGDYTMNQQHMVENLGLKWEKMLRLQVKRTGEVNPI